MSAPAPAKPSTAKAWWRALAMTAPITSQPHRILPVVIEELARRYGDAPALLADDEWFTFGGLAARSRQYARWAIAQGIERGERVALLMPNAPEYMAMWLGVTRAGAIAALVNTNLAGSALAHCINVAAPKHLIVDARLLDRVVAVKHELATSPMVWVRGGPGTQFPRIDDYVHPLSAAELAPAESREVTISECALYIYTSGTTGLPKAANVSHARLMQWTHWFAGLMNICVSDRMYNCLPMFHSAGGVLATGAVLVGGGSVVIGERFSAGRFWEDIVGWDCTLFQYIGELCRYLVHSPAHPCERDHRLRLCCGNGLRGDVWNVFKARFRIPQILEFYASTEGNVSLANVEGTPGAIGRIPRFLAHRFPAALVRYDDATGAPLRDDRGCCVPCAPQEIGEAIGRLLKDPANVGTWFEGYTDAAASEQRVLRGVFEAGDAWCRTGDLMRRDEAGYFYFVDRIGDTFRWKGENVATTEVAAAICRFAGVADATVYGVAVPGAEGRAGMAAIVASQPFDLAAFRRHLIAALPPYARPMFLRVRDTLDSTDTFKHSKSALAREGYDPRRIADPLYIDDAEHQSYVHLDSSTYDRIQSGESPVTTPCPDLATT